MCLCRLYVNRYCVGGKEGNGEEGEEGSGGGGWSQMGQLALSKGLARIGIRCHVQRATIKVRGFLFLHSEFMHAQNIITCNVCVSDIKEKYYFCADHK